MVRVSIKKKNHHLHTPIEKIHFSPIIEAYRYSILISISEGMGFFFYHCQTIVWFSFPFLLYIFFLFVDFKNMMIASVWRIERSSSEATEMRNTMNHINIFFLSMFYDNIQVPISDRWNNLQSAQYIGLQGCAITKIGY